MAGLAGAAKIPLMGVVVRVTGIAGSWKGDLRDALLPMAGRASQSDVRAGQWEMCLGAVIEPPDRPAIWRVARGASRA